MQNAIAKMAAAHCTLQIDCAIYLGHTIQRRQADRFAPVCRLRVMASHSLVMICGTPAGHTGRRAVCMTPLQTWSGLSRRPGHLCQSGMWAAPAACHPCLQVPSCLWLLYMGLSGLRSHAGVGHQRLKIISGWQGPGRTLWTVVCK